MAHSLIKYLILVACFLSLPMTAKAVTVPHAFAERNTSVSTTSTSYVDITDMSIASGSFTAGKDYFIQYCGQFTETANTTFGWIQAVHGSTAFAESEQAFYRSSTNADYGTYCWFTVWTAVSGEGIKLQYKIQVATPTVTGNFISLIAIQLTDYLTAGTDYCFAESATDESLSTTPDDGASCTVTPGSASTWLALTYAQDSRADTTTRQISRMVRSGEASSSLPASSILPEQSAGLWSHYHARTFSFGASSNTIKEQSEASAAAGTRTHSSVFLLNLSKFSAFGAAYTEASQSLTSTTMTEIQTASITPTVTGDVWTGAAFVFDKTTISGDVEFRVQVDGSDQPAGQTTADLDIDQFNTTHTDNDIPVGLITLSSMDTSAHTVDLDANRNVDSDVKYRQVWAVSLDIDATANYILQPMVMQ